MAGPPLRWLLFATWVLCICPDPTDLTRADLHPNSIRDGVMGLNPNIPPIMKCRWTVADTQDTHPGPPRAIVAIMGMLSRPPLPNVYLPVA